MAFQPVGADPSTGQLPAIVEARINALIDEIGDLKADLTAGKVPDGQLPDRLSTSGLSASYAAVWKPTTAVLAGALALAPDGSIIQRNANGTTRATYDATEQALWTAVSVSVPTATTIATSRSVALSIALGG